MEALFRPHLYRCGRVAGPLYLLNLERLCCSFWRPLRIAGSSYGAGKALDCMYIEYFFPTLVAWTRVLASLALVLTTSLGEFPARSPVQKQAYHDGYNCAPAQLYFIRDDAARFADIARRENGNDHRHYGKNEA